MSTDLIPVLLGRPPIIVVDGCTVYLSVKDREYLRVKTQLRALMAAAHPDKHPQRPQTGLFRVRRLQLQAWLLAQRRIYWALHQMPPDWHGPTEAPPGTKPIRPRVLLGQFQTRRFKGAHCSDGVDPFPPGIHRANRIPVG